MWGILAVAVCVRLGDVGQAPCRWVGRSLKREGAGAAGWGGRGECLKLGGGLVAGERGLGCWRGGLVPTNLRRGLVAAGGACVGRGVRS